MDIPTSPQAEPLCAVIELFGHTRVAGQITESPLGGGALIRLTVPASGSYPAHTRDLNPKAIYAIHYCDQAAMISALPSCQPSPVVQIVKAEVAEAYEERLRTRDAKTRPSLPFAFPGDENNEGYDDDLDP